MNVLAMVDSFLTSVKKIANALEVIASCELKKSLGVPTPQDGPLIEESIEAPVARVVKPAPTPVAPAAPAPSVVPGANWDQVETPPTPPIPPVDTSQPAPVQAAVNAAPAPVIEEGPTIEELRVQLTAIGIKVSSKATKATLIKKLDAARAALMGTPPGVAAPVSEEDCRKSLGAYHSVPSDEYDAKTLIAEHANGGTLQDLKDLNDPARVAVVYASLKKAADAGVAKAKTQGLI